MKRSVSAKSEVYPPLRILSYAYAAYNEPTISEKDRLPHASAICAGYLGAFRINEVLPLLKSQFKRRISLEKREFMIIENTEVEKSEKLRNVAIYPADPLTIPIIARLNQVEDGGKMFGFKDRTMRRVLARISLDSEWKEFPHFLLRAQRNRFLSIAFSPEERERIIGWERREQQGVGKKTFFKRTVDIYSSLNWMWYAERLAMLTENYWQTETIPPEITGWLDALKRGSSSSS